MESSEDEENRLQSANDGTSLREFAVAFEDAAYRARLLSTELYQTWESASGSRSVIFRVPLIEMLLSEHICTFLRLFVRQMVIVIVTHAGWPNQPKWPTNMDHL
jgi:hypothetical protein